MTANAILKIRSYSTKDGLLLLQSNDNGIKSAIKSIVDLCSEKHGGYIKVQMQPPYKKRTLDQNSKYWAMCTEFGNYCGMTREDVSMGVKYRAVEEGLWEEEKIPFSKTGAKRPVSTTKSDTRQMGILIDVLYRIASEDGYVFKEDIF